ncbi:MAG: autotransporter domain-containing protein [Zoogloeaceae bacterium]|jgi:autotransporter-associated beta strand protein|nr:autotransporter domain-containing protein [Zoogloeaceae bacterium]
MQKSGAKRMKLSADTAVAALLSLVATPAAGVDIVYPGGSLGDPSSVIRSTAPSMPNSFFPSGSTSGNNVRVSGGSISGHVFGGIAADSGVNSTGNTVNITGGTIGTSASGGNIFGGWTFDATVSNNRVNVSNATVQGIIFGGWANGGSADVTVSGNSVLIDSGTLRGNIYGGYSQGQNGQVSGNSVTIDGGNVTRSGTIIAGGYSAILQNEVYNNSVTISGGTINNAAIYGGRGQVGSTIHDNRVTITGGTLTGTIYGGQSVNGTAAGIVTNNIVSILGGNVTATIYGGYSTRATATGNTVTIGGSAVLNGSDLYGGYVSSGGGDAFTGNILNKNNAAAVGVAQNFEFVNFGYSGNANLEALYTTPTGSLRPGVILNTNAYTINFGGAITGTGNLTKTGTGTLILSGDGNNIQNKDVQIQQGTLQLGNGGTTGRITASGGFNISSAAALAYNHSNNVTETQRITGDGKVIQRGSGTLNLANTSNSFTGGTEIASGTLLVTNGDSYNWADDIATRAGYLTFTGGAGQKTIAVQHTGSYAWLTNSFRTQAGAGNNNIVTLAIPPNSPTGLLTIEDVNISDKGGAFYVAGGTTMSVISNTNLYFVNNKANGANNDLFVESSGTFNLYSGTNTQFASGIDGSGTLNLYSSGPIGIVSLWSGTGSEYRMGTTNVTGSGANLVSLYLVRDTPTDDRTVFTNSGAVNIRGDFSGSGSLSSGSALLMGDGIVEANSISATRGAILMPMVINIAAQDLTPDTLTLRAPTVTLDNFGLGYIARGPQNSLTTDAQSIPQSKNSLLNIESGNVTIGNGTIIIDAGSGGTFDQGDYLIIRTTSGFNGGGINALNNVRLTALANGFVIPNSAGSPRGTYSFHLGGEPSASGEHTAGTNNIWLMSDLNSLSMDWTGGSARRDTPNRGNWGNGALFYSLQANGGNHESQFLTGDKVYISGTNSFEIGLPGGSNFPDPSGIKIVVSGLVVGQNASGSITSGGNYTLSGAGGITADAATAFGDYVGDTLIPTGKLQKYGNSTLTFTNTGGNLFREGIELYGGAVQFTRADQLNDGGHGITFESDATLRTLGRNIRLTNDIAVKDNVVAGFGAATGADVTYTGTLTGTNLATLQKTGAGVVRLASSVSSIFAGTVRVSGGTLDIVGNYPDTQGFTVENGGTLAGKGTIGALTTGGVIESGGTLRPNGLDASPLTVKGDLTFEAGGNLDVGAKYAGGGWRSDYVEVTDGGRVTIDPAANLNAEIDYWGGPGISSIVSSVITVIDASAGIVDDPAALYGTLNYFGLPRGMKVEQLGWRAGDLFQLGFTYNPDEGYASTSGKHNRNEIGKTLDWFVINHDPGLREVFIRLSDSTLSDEEIGQRLDQLHGDLAANAAFLALKEPWRHPFNRLATLSPYGQPQQAWGELIGRHESADYDGNAHGFTLERYGIALGVDRPVSPNSTVGATFQYTMPHLRQKTGNAKADDYELGLYNMTRLMDTFDLKAYLGYSYQRYNLTRTVSLPGKSGRYEAFYEKLKGNTTGNAWSASLELTKPIEWRQDVRILPIVAFDFERARIRGYRESAGHSALTYGNISMGRTMFRFGLEGDLTLQNGLHVRPKLQYAMQVGGQKYPSVDVRFVGGTLPNQRIADIWGSRIGRNYWNIGLGGSWKLDSRGDRMFYLNYDGKVYDRATSHTAMAAFIMKW